MLVTVVRARAGNGPYPHPATPIIVPVTPVMVIAVARRDPGMLLLVVSYRAVLLYLPWSGR